jgi:8-oxo-dGTP pyrophosphatase MutT (NUDIX family)
MLKKWDLINRKIVLKTNLFDVCENRFRKPNNELTPIKTVLLDTPDWVNVIAVNENKEILLIRQFRFGTNKIELEIPGGIMNPEESPKEAAVRELKEETGYKVDQIKKIGNVAANPAFMNNHCHSFMARISEKGETQFDPDEIIECEFASLKAIREYLKNGTIMNAYSVLAFFWLFLSQNQLNFSKSF